MGLSRTELATLARNAGFTGNDVNIAVAVALAESGGDPRNYNGKDKDRSYGLFQINMIGDLGPDRRKRFNLPNNDALFDPATNARVAYAIWKDQGWQPWTTYTKGTYKKFLDGGSGGDAAESSGGGGGGGGLDPVLGIASSINSFGETFRNGFASFGGILVAVVLLALGMVILLRNQVGSIVPGGKIAKVAKIAKGVSG